MNYAFSQNKAGINVDANCFEMVGNCTCVCFGFWFKGMPPH